MKALQTMPAEVDALPGWTLAWTKGLADESEAALWLEADIHPLVTGTMNEDGTTEVKPRPRAPLETPMKLIQLIAVDQAVDHLVTLMQTRQVGFRVMSGARAMIGAVRKFLSDGDNRSHKETSRMRMDQFLVCSTVRPDKDRIGVWTLVFFVFKYSQ